MICQTDLNSSCNGGSMLVALWVCHDVMARHHRCRHCGITRRSGGTRCRGCAVGSYRHSEVEICISVFSGDLGGWFLLHTILVL